MNIKRFLMIVLSAIFVFGVYSNLSYAQETQQDVKIATINKDNFKWGKYYSLPDLPYELAINSYKKNYLDVKVKDPLEGTTRLKIVPSRNFVYIYEKDINQFGGWRCVDKSMYEDDSFIAEIATVSLSILKEAGIITE